MSILPEERKIGIRPRGRVWVDNEDDDDFLCIQVHDGFVYDIPLSRMRTAEAVLDWIHQICVGKRWGKEVSNDFLEIIFHDIIPTEMWSGNG